MRLRDRQTPAPGTAGYSFCETAAASGASPWHIRKLGPAGPKYGGGADSPALCGRRMDLGGWDLYVVITTEHLKHACRACVEKLEATRGEPNS